VGKIRPKNEKGTGGKKKEGQLFKKTTNKAEDTKNKNLRGFQSRPGGEKMEIQTQNTRGREERQGKGGRTPGSRREKKEKPWENNEKEKK